ncbi:SWIM zinc finger family protein [Archangium sp.]|uniref:SWIM zinc finger family protein n=1 Tax=Archangium sp. TaxID=1872627 RepID=UPI002D29E0B6|nr:SWIM zinc finger family protein [Archangium sp.]HYO54570.1 SWIM zinc finger family protein [Archangium sp.]
MSDFEWREYKSRPKRPPPARGIKMKKAGATWWGQRWLEALERFSGGYSNRLSRGRSYARAGRTHDLEVKAGEVTARVTGSRPTPYKVSLRLAKLDDATWNKAIAAMAAQAHFSAELLAGEMPKAIDEAFHTAGASLFPEREADLDTHCTCPDWANPCKHVAATHYVLGEALDKDPFLLFELRGRTRAEVLAALRAARGGEAPGARGKAPGRAGSEVPTVQLGKLPAGAYEAWRDAPPPLHLGLERPEVPGALLRQLGAPPGWTESTSPAELLGPLIRAASERALRLALVGSEDVMPPAPPPRRRGRPPRRG